MWLCAWLVLLQLVCYISQILPATINSVTTPGIHGACLSEEERAVIRDDIHQQALSTLSSVYLPPCACGGPGLWTRIAHLNMSDPSQQCPSSWNLITTPVRGCVSSNSSGQSCDSAIFPTNGQLYSHVWKSGSLPAREPKCFVSLPN